MNLYLAEGEKRATFQKGKINPDKSITLTSDRFAVHNSTLNCRNVVIEK